MKLKAITGKSAIDFIHKIRFNRACQLLKEGKYSVSEISFMVGYNSPSYFAARFKKYMGCLPTEYGKIIYDVTMNKRIMLFVQLVCLSLTLWGQTNMSGFSITKEDSLQHEGKSVELIKIVNKTE